MLSRWRQSLDRDFFMRFCGTKTSAKWKMDRGLMTHDRPTHGHKRKRLLRASDENHFPIEIQIFMLSIRSSWNYYRPITSLSRDENVSKMNSFGPSSSPRSRKKTFIFHCVHFFCKSWNSSCYVIIVIGNCSFNETSRAIELNIHFVKCRYMDH